MNNKISKNFPFLSHHKKIIYLDSAGTSLKPKIVIDSIVEYYEKYSINNHTVIGNNLFKKVQSIIKETREVIARKINSQIEEIFFSPSTTYSLNTLAISLKNILEKGDEIYLTHLEHSSNCYPWQAIAKEKEAQIKFLTLNKKFSIDLSKLEKMISKKTKVVSFFHMSNSVGSINQVEEITKKIKEINPECLVIVDACQSIAHLPIDVAKWKIDALVFSGHKVYGPTGIGILWIKKQLGEKMPDIWWGGGKKKSPNEGNENSFPINQKFEVGTLPLAQIFGLKASFYFLNSLKIEKIESYEKKLKNYLIKRLNLLKNINLYSKNKETLNIILFNLKNHHSHDVAEYLGKNNIFVRSGNFCCPYLAKVIKEKSAIRISLSIYNTKKDIDELISYLSYLVKNPELIVNIY